MMRSASREAVQRLGGLQAELAGPDADSATLIGVAQELYSVARLLGTQPRLRRTLADASTQPDARAGLIGGLLAGAVGEAAVAITQAAVRERWSSPWDLADALELSAAQLLFAAADAEGTLDEVEDELFRFERILDAQGDLASLLDEQSVPAERRTGLLDSVLGGRVREVTRVLLEQVVGSDRKRSVGLAIDDLLELAALRQERSIARVVTATELSPAQQERLVAALTEIYGRPITLRTAVNPAVRGGVVIRVGGEIIDGSIAARLTSARTAVAR